jgi:hypothetical protein
MIPTRSIAIGLCLSTMTVCPEVMAALVSTAPSLQIDLHPGSLVDGDIRALDVSVSATLPPIKAGERLAKLPVIADSVRTSAGQMADFILTDDRGIVPTHSADVTIDPATIDRYWIVDRAVAGRVTWRYRIAVDPAAPIQGGPMLDLRSSHGSISGAAMAFIALPVDTVKRNVAVHWALDALPAEATGLSSFGPGDASSHEALNTEQLALTYYMAGRPGVFKAPGSGFFASWQGDPSFDMTELMGWAVKLHDFYGPFFRDPKPVFGVFGRENSFNPGSGIGITDSFAFTFGNGTTQAELKSLLAHEMLHVWVKPFDHASDDDTLVGAWFEEGLAVYYQRTLPYRAGAITTDDYLADLNGTALAYYADPMIATPNDRVAPNFWADTRIRILPYHRGSLYFAGLNQDIIRASNGKRSLDDLVLALLAERRAGRALTLDTWKTFLRRELGEAGMARWQAMMDGHRIDLPSDAFGPCFVKEDKPLGEFDMGYDFVASRAHGHVVQGLEPGSNAALAGLRDGDVVRTVTGGGDVAQEKIASPVTLDVERAGQPVTIRYIPRGKILAVPQWTRRPDAPAQCRALP